MSKLVAFVLAFILLSSCSANGESESSERGPEGSVLVESDSMALPVDMNMVMGSMIVADLRSVHPYHVIDPGTRRYVAGVGERGEGPGEVGDPSSILGGKRSRQVALLDTRNRRLHQGQIAEDGMMVLSSGTHADINIEGIITAAVMLDDGRIIASGIHQEPLIFVELGSDGRVVRGFGAEIGGPPEAQIAQRHHAWQHRIRTDGDAIAVAYRFADMIDVFDSSGTRQQRLRGPQGFEPGFGRAPNGRTVFAGPRDQRYGYIDVAIGRELVFGLYSGRDGSDDDPGLGDAIHVFSKEGHFIRDVRVDHDLIALLLSPDETRLYGASHAPNIAIIEYSTEMLVGQNLGSSR